MLFNFRPMLHKRKVVVIAAMALLLGELLLRDEKNPRSMWVSDFVRKRDTLGFYKVLMDELSDGDPKRFRNFLRMSKVNI